ncbi:Nucleolar protein 9 [Sporothrix curviconia]|uniref:Nucleolar protein 9 n=1 Tax=Sporothrix curviconia TaxID=1260050 RepID=A0ABP0CFN6_9PEZI
MAKPRKSKRQQQRDERRKKKHELEIIDGDVDDSYVQEKQQQSGQQSGQQQDYDYERQPHRGGRGGGGDEPPPKRTKVHKSASGANNTPLTVRRDGALFFDDVDGAAPQAGAPTNGDGVGSERAAAGSGKRKRDDETGGDENNVQMADYGDYGENGDGENGETEFFGLLTDSEHEYFRRADELLELNDFPGGDDERRVFLANVFREARGKELKVASSQSCSRLMERLIQVASVRQKKRLFAAFRGHIQTLVSHRFSSHCCEQLFLQSAPWVGRDGQDPNDDADDADDADDVEEGDDELPTLEESFLFVLDELEAGLGSLLVHCFASHTLRVLLVILAGRPLDGLATQSLLRSKRKENVRVGAFAQNATPHGNDDTADDGAATADDGAATAAATTAMAADRIVPESFTFAVQKILGDVSQAIEGPLLNVLPTHPTGNPSLQLLLELDMAEKKEIKGKANKAKKEEAAVAEGQDAPATPSVSLLERLLPGTPATLSDPTSQASTLVRTLIYDPIGSRLLETLIAHCPGKLFKAIYNTAFAYVAPKKGEKGEKGDESEPARPMAVYLRNDVACFPSMRVIERLGRDDLTSVVQHQVLQLQADGTPAPPPTSNGGRTTPPMTVVGQLLDRGRFNVLRTLFERCQARGVDSRMVQHLVNALQAAVGGGRQFPGALVKKLCLPDEAEVAAQRKTGKGGRSAAAAAAGHACTLLTAMLTIPGGPASAVQAALLNVSGEQLAALATQSAAGARVLVAALHSPNSLRGHAAKIPLNKQLVARLVPHHLALATSPAGHVVLVAIIQTPSRTEVKAPPPRDQKREGNQKENQKEGNGDKAAAAPPTSELSLPFHLKDALIAQLAAHEDELRQSWCGRIVWRAWKGDLWRTRRSEWVHFAKAGEPEGLKLATAPVLLKDREPIRGHPPKRTERTEQTERSEVHEEAEEAEEVDVEDKAAAKKARKEAKEAKEAKRAEKEAKKARKAEKKAKKAKKAEEDKEDKDE